MPSVLTDAIREAYATSRSDVVFLDTLEIRSPAADSMFLVQDRKDWTLRLETGEDKLFVATAFRFILPAAGDNGIQELNVAVDNADQRVSDFVNMILTHDSTIKVIFRPYMSSDVTQPQMNPPLVLFMTDVVITAVEVTGRATFAELLNRKFLSTVYSHRRFPAL